MISLPSILLFFPLLFFSSFSTIYSFTEGERLQALHQQAEQVWRYNQELLLLQDELLDSSLSFWNYTHNCLFNYLTRFLCGNSYLSQPCSVLRK
ncbi:MAG: hypothetical protein GF308_07515 [Candidatus Heimdallarchaeota archaeon]|nr:hypothetical protein [Candidatus Heimdallarchaeota archaeon]